MLTDLNGLAELECELIRRLPTVDPQLKAKGVMMGRKPKLTNPHVGKPLRDGNQRKSLVDVSLSYNVSHSTISRRSADHRKRPVWPKVGQPEVALKTVNENLRA
jgi:hypothetical protein